MNCLLLRSLAALCAVFVITLAGCATNQTQMPQSGFLEDYSDLQLNDMKDRARYGYIERTTNFAQYTKVMIDPVEFWIASDRELSAEGREELQRMVDYFFDAVNDSLGKKYTIVNAPGPDVLRLRIALSEQSTGAQHMQVVSASEPVGHVIANGKKLARGSHAFMGKASVEVELLDSVSGDRIAAAVDDRVAGHGSLDGRWGDAKKAFDYWSDLMLERLQRLTRASRMKNSMQNVYI